jgi:glycosyltransferase involved in cell wall biosynthesis
VILFVSGEYPPDIGGVGDYTSRLRAALTQRGWRSEVLSRRKVLHWDARSVVRLVRDAPSGGIVHIQYQAAAFDLLGDICLAPAVLRLARRGVRSVTTFHDVRVPYLFPRAAGLRPRAVRLLARSSHAVIGADQRDLRALGGPSARHFHVPIGANVSCAPPPDYDRAAFRASLGLAIDDLAVVYFGTLNSSKGVDMLLDAFDRVRAERPRSKLLMLGGEVGGSDRTDRVAAARLNGRIAAAGDAVVRSGWLAAQRLSMYLLAGDVALLPYTDGASARRGSLLACAAHELPIVSTLPAGVEVAASVEAVEQEPSALADAVQRVSRDPAPLQAASRALANQVSWEHIAARHSQIYESLLYSRRR